MSSSYRGRHHARHRVAARGRRVPRALSSSLVLPTLAAAALVVTATGATVAESAPAAGATHQLTSSETAIARVEQAAADATTRDLASRRQASAVQSAALQGRTEAKQRAARTAARKAAARTAVRKAAARAKAQREGKRWVTAIRAGRLSSDFGPRWGKTHDGLDIGAPSGTPIYAMSKGRVVRSFFDSSFGNKVEIEYWDGTVSWYAHMSTRLVQPGDTVMPGDMVGRVGNTGYSFGAHLHIEIHPGPGVDQPRDPAPWLRKKGIMLG